MGWRVGLSRSRDSAAMVTGGAEDWTRKGHQEEMMGVRRGSV